MQIINLTPHTINETTTGTSFKPSGIVARVATKQIQVDTIPNNIPVYETTFGEVVGVPDEQENVMYIVSAMCLNAMANREDLIAPGNLKRDENGQPVGCMGFRR